MCPFYSKIWLLELNHERLALESDLVAGFELFFTPGFDHAVETDLTGLDGYFGLTAGPDHSGQLHKLIELDRWFSRFCHLSYRW